MGNSIWNEGQVIGGDAGGPAAQGGAGILVESGAMVDDVTNLGRIVGGLNGDASTAYGIRNDGTIRHLANAQGGSLGALTFYGDLPENYDIILNSTSSYGQLAVGSDTSSTQMTVGVSSLSAGPITGSYNDVITGVSASNITNETVVFKTQGSALAVLDHSTLRDPNANSTDWDLRVWNYGTDMADPQHYLLDTNAVILRYAMTYDCNLFDVNGVCITGSLRFTDIKGAYGVPGNSSELAGVLAGALRIGTKVRLGGFMDFGANIDNVDGVDFNSHLPMIGGFVGYSDQSDGAGLQARVSVAYEHQDAELTRANLMGTASKVKGDSAFETYGFLGEMAWGFDIGSTTQLTPFIGLAATRSTRDGYNESGKTGIVEDPFSYASYSATQVTGMAGLRVKGMLTDELSFRLGVGVEHDFSYNADPFKISGDFGSASYTSNLSPADWRFIGTAGLAYLIAPNKELDIDGYASQFTKDTADYGVTVGVKLGF